MSSNLLSIEVTERLVEYDPELRRNWRDAGWWDAEGWRGFLPRAEWHRALTKFRTQAIQSGYHFVEVMHMRELEAEGLQWQYEGYNFFEEPSPTATLTVKGYAKIASSFSADDLSRLHQAAWRYEMAYGMKPATPDLFVYREQGARIIPLRFVELKQNDPLKPRQMLGLALIQDVLGASIEVVRYVERGHRSPAKTWVIDWPRGGLIPNRGS